MHACLLGHGVNWGEIFTLDMTSFIVDPLTAISNICMKQKVLKK